MTLRPKPTLISGAIMIAVAFALGMGFDEIRGEVLWSLCQSRYVNLNAREVCGAGDAISKSGYAVIEGDLQRYIEAQKAAGQITDASIYFRDLENGPAFGINEDADFAPASLFKLPFALALLTEAAKRPSLLDQEVRAVTPENTFFDYYSPDEQVQVGQTYSIRELIRRMIVYSDNYAYAALLSYLRSTGNESVVIRTFIDLGLIDPTKQGDDTISVRRYAGIFRGLYNASYLDPDQSDQLLSWLRDVTFAKGLRAGVPGSVPVAHKFGERDVSATIHQLHDCGIVYFPRNPYLLCIMTRGENYDDLSATIEQLSKRVYDEVKSRELHPHRSGA